MKKIIFTIGGSALVALSVVQFAAAAEQHRVKPHHHTYYAFRDSNAFAAPAYDAAASEVERYSGGYSAPAGR